MGRFYHYAGHHYALRTLMTSLHRFLFRLLLPLRRYDNYGSDSSSGRALVGRAVSLSSSPTLRQWHRGPFHTLAGPGKTSESLPQESESLPREAREDLFRRRAESATVGHWNGLVSGRRLRLQVSAVTRSQAGSRESARRRYFKFSFSTGGRASVSGGPT